MAGTLGTLETLENSITPNNWHHVAFSYGSNNIVNIYVDGINRFTQSNIAIDGGIIENQTEIDMIVGSNMEGKIDNVKMFNKELNSLDIQYLSQPGNYDTAPQDTICDLRFNETDRVPSLLDNQEHSNQCVSVGNVEYKDGLVLGSKSINTNDGHVLIQDSISIDTGIVSVSAWVN